MLEDNDPEVRAQAAKVLADSRTKKAGEALVAALDDESNRVKAFAAIGIGKCRNVTALPKLYDVIIANNDDDVFLRHACVQALWYLNEKEKILKLVDHESSAMRLAVLLAMRKLEDPRVKYFLGDSEQHIRYEAIRAINDLDLPTAGPALAAEIEKSTPHETLQDQMIHRRLINANLRVGTEESATRLLKYAARADLPDVLRSDALAALEEWAEPTPFDSTVGFHRPLDPAKRAAIADVVKKNLGAVFENAEGNLIADATRVALKFDAEAPVDLLVEQLKKSDGETDARIGALRGLARQQPDVLEPMWPALLADESQPIRAAATETLVELKPEAGLEATLKLAESKNLRDLQAAFRILGTTDSPKAAEFIAEKMKAPKSVKPGAQLDLIEAAEKRSEPEIKSALAEYQNSFGGDLYKPFDVALQGGDIENGKTLFLTHAAGQCAKCHKAGKLGIGVAGPDLSDIGKRHDAKYLLDALINPSAVVVPGYGMTMMTLKSGESVGGTFIKENDDAVTLKIPDPKNADVQVERDFKKSDIATRQPPISAMPPMLFLTKREVRDLVAFLSAQKKEPKDAEGHQ